MEKIKRLIIAVCTALAVCCISLFAGCTSDSGEEMEPTASPTAPATSAAAPTEAPADESSSPEATTEATATPDAEEQNLLEYAIEDDGLLLGGDSWTPIEETWAGPLQEKRDGCESSAMQEFVETTCSDGNEGICYHFYSEATTGYHIVGNTYGISDLIEANKTYKLTVSLKYTVPNPGEAMDNMAIGCSLDETSMVKVNSSENWQTVTCTFTVGDEFETAYIYVSPVEHEHESIVIGDIQAGFDLLIDSISLVEVAE
ncbi:MAG TPA: hypothetical protein DEF06_02305 [Clostridiales bacterium]|uniref:CBM-cenC domain-containing protein n=1 Tax=Candidatus Egerieisoma faecipullorum TaxID=2840963 RepID=A0A9D1L9E3_9CLOT|nr:hypothetical protein [Clostridiales bacterium]HIU29859.1 hypothetical protein [Candidatus Egerieisoma faecipullorum]